LRKQGWRALIRIKPAREPADRIAPRVCERFFVSSFARML